MRFRKRLKIIKGVHLNLSSGGASLSIGGKGASLNIGEKGTYLNYGIPGTGLYDRKKISAGDSNVNKYDNKVEVSVNIKVDDDGSIIVSDENGNLFSEEKLNKIKRTQAYKDMVKRLSENVANDINSKTIDFVDIYKFAPIICGSNYWEKKLNEIEEIKYIEEKIEDFKEPNKNEIIERLKWKSKSEIKDSIFFWKKRETEEKRQKFVEENVEVEYLKEYNDKQKEWENSKIQHYECEKLRKEEIEEHNEIIREKKNLIKDKILKGDDKYIIEKCEEIINNTTLPVDFSVDFEYQNQKFMIDLDLPEIEDMNTKKANILSSGKVSVKEKSKKELKSEYARCVIGMAFYFCAEIFNISPSINKIVVSGYTQRKSAKTGNINDDYVYSIRFTRDIFSNLNIKEINPIEAIENFEHRKDMTSNYELKTITPFEE